MTQFKSFVFVALLAACAGTEPVHVEPGGYDIDRPLETLDETVLSYGCEDGLGPYVIPGNETRLPYVTCNAAAYECELIEQAPVMTGRLMQRWVELRCDLVGAVADNATESDQ